MKGGIGCPMPDIRNKKGSFFISVKVRIILRFRFHPQTIMEIIKSNAYTCKLILIACLWLSITCMTKLILYIRTIDNAHTKTSSKIKREL